MRRKSPASPHSLLPTPALGIDVGGVLVDFIARGEDTSFFGTRPIETPATEGSHEALSRLLDLFAGRVYIVSKAGPRIAGLTRQWLVEQQFVGPGALAESDVFFVTERSEKNTVCRRVGITHFIDDRLDVLKHLATVEMRVLYTGGLGDDEPPADIPTEVSLAPTWPDCVDLLEGHLAQRSQRAAEGRRARPKKKGPGRYSS